ncbi:MAG: M48 family metalloprotease [Thermoanaerobaculia bacterium]
MTLRPRSPLLTLLTLLLFVLSCVTTHLPPISSSGAGFEPLKDEAKLWRNARAEEEKLLDEAPIYDDPLLEDYLEGVVAKLNPAGMAANRQIRYQVRVIEDPTLNAFAYPHGSMYVHTGLLARIENESQLATVLGHEMTHVENRHTVRYQRSARNREVGFAIAALTAAVILAEEEADALSEGDWDKAWRTGVLGQILVGLGLQLAFLASVHGYGRDLEREADFGSFDKLENAGYDLRESPNVYELLQDGHGDTGDLETFFFGSHPKLSQRVESAREHLARRSQASQGSEVTEDDSTTFERRIRPVLRDDARQNIELGRFELAAFELEKALALLPEDAEAHLLMGQVKLAQADEPQDPAAEARLRGEALQSLRESVRLAPDRPDVHRELGLFAYRADDFRTACAELATYVELAPDAKDAQSARGYLLELKRDGHCASS